MNRRHPATGLRRFFCSWAREDNALSRKVIGKPMYPCATNPSWQVDDSLAPLPGELVLAKTSSGPLNSTKLDQMFHTED